MSENPLSITKLNDFIFCPASIYFHSLDEDTDKLSYQSECQLNGTHAHITTDNGKYSTRKNILQAISVYSEKYDLFGKIDIYNLETKILIERKKKIKTIYDGYIFQLYAQYFALTEMGYEVKKIQLYSMDDNKTRPILLPSEDKEMFNKFEKLITQIRNFSFDSFVQENRKKCDNCIYEPLCIYSKCEDEI